MPRFDRYLKTKTYSRFLQVKITKRNLLNDMVQPRFGISHESVLLADLSDGWR